MMAISKDTIRTLNSKDMILMRSNNRVTIRMVNSSKDTTPMANKDTNLILTKGTRTNNKHILLLRL
jgi:hypothetical protein